MKKSYGWSFSFWALAAVPAFPQLSFTHPVFLTAPHDGTNRIFVVEKPGRIRVFANDANASSAEVFLDISSEVSSKASEMGLLGLAFDPEYRSNGYFYVYYTATGDYRNVVSRFQVSKGSPNRADRSTETVLLTMPKDKPYTNHNAGMMAFGPDKMLYIGVGDGGSEGDPAGHGQDLTVPWGKMLRINPRDPEHLIPRDNPFVGQGGGVREEIWAYGLRNPWRFSFDSVTGKLWVGDVGQDRREEIDLVTRGANLGWSVYEGSLEYNNPKHLPASQFTAPIFEYGHDVGVAVIGGVVYRGSALSSLRGKYVYGDFGPGTVWALGYDGSRVTSNTEIARADSLCSFGTDENEELYLIAYTGKISKLKESASTVPAFPKLLSETGLFQDTAGLVPSGGLHEYSVISPLWSDGARKRRWISMPKGTAIGFHAREPWEFPQETVFIKHFDLDLGPAKQIRLETRVLKRTADGWRASTYRWNPDQRDATLVEDPQSQDFIVSDPTVAGGKRKQSWNFPAERDCFRCHTDSAGTALGVRTLQFTAAQLEEWNGLGLFDRDIGPAGQYPAFPDPYGSTSTLERRSRAWLDANCAHCHRPGGPTPVEMDLRWDTQLASTALVGVAPTAGDLGIDGAERVYPGSREKSILWSRISRTDGYRMPPLASSVADTRAVKLIGEWIDSLSRHQD